jgi:hypothetical protein
MFIAELSIYIKYLKGQFTKGNGDMKDSKRKAYYLSFIKNLSDAMKYYKSLPANAIVDKLSFDKGLLNAEVELAAITRDYSLT